MSERAARQALLASVTTVVFIVAGALAASGVQPIEVVATLLVVPVFAVALLRGRMLGLAAAAAALAGYGALRYLGRGDAGAVEVAVLTVARAVTYAFVAHVGALAQRLVALLADEPSPADERARHARARRAARGRGGAPMAAAEQTPGWHPPAPAEPSPARSWQEGRRTGEVPAWPGAPGGVAPAAAADTGAASFDGTADEDPSRRLHGYPVEGQHGSAEPAGHPNQSAYGDRSGYPDQSAYGDRSGYQDQSAYGDRSGYPDQSGYGDPAAHHDPSGYGDRSGYDDGGYGDQVAYGDTGDGGDHGYAGREPLPAWETEPWPGHQPATEPARAANGGAGPQRAALPAVDPETKLWTAQYLRERLAAEQARADEAGAVFSLVLLQVPDEPLEPLPYRRQVTVLRDLGHQFVAGGLIDHLVHVPDRNHHWFAVVLPDVDRDGAQALESRLRAGIQGYLRSRGIALHHIESASLTAPDDDPAMDAIWQSLIGSGDPGAEPAMAYED